MPYQKKTICKKQGPFRQDIISASKRAFSVSRPEPLSWPAFPPHHIQDVSKTYLPVAQAGFFTLPIRNRTNHMNEIIPINQEENTVNARDLHVFLGSKQQFADWIKSRIKQYGFVENQDFTKLHKKMKLSRTGQTGTEYHITIDMAKELSMVERNEKGKQARQYFIECERRAKDPIAALNDPTLLRKTLLTYSERVISLEKTVDEQTPKVAALDRIATADGSMCVTDAAKHLQIRPLDLFRHMNTHKWIYRRPGGNRSWIAYQEYIQRGYLEHKVTTISKSDGSEKMSEQVRVTPKGITKLSECFCNLFGGAA